MINQNGSRVQAFLRRHTVFTHAEFARWIGADGPDNRRTESLLRYYVEAGRLLRPRRGLYVSSGATDPYLVAGKLSDDSILAYHTALAFHGRAHSVSHVFYHLSRRAARPLVLGSDAFETVPFPKALRDRGAEATGVVSVDRQGQDVRATTLERTMVDVLDRPDLGGGWEEVWRSLESVEFFDLDAVIEYALLLGNSTTVAKVGLFLEEHSEPLMVEETYLKRLEEHRPRGRHYLSRKDDGPSRLVPRWNLIVPSMILDREWEEPA
ncbi:MAG TPA: transcriptional regulator [Armatimonadota bacterium]|jgi:predicted transcriptional regulator of viral defense system